MIQALHVDDLPAAVALLGRVGLPSGAANLARYLRWQPDGGWGLFEDGGLVGTVTLLQFGHIGFVGCMAIRSEQQGRGLGRSLLQHAHAAAQRAGITTLLLEATEGGRWLYEKFGYVIDDETWIVSRTRVAPSDPVSIIHERRAILDLDRRATGAPRDTMIGSLVDDHRGGVERTAGLIGYGLVVGDRLGPVIASDPGAGRALIDRLAGASTVSAIPASSSAAQHVGRRRVGEQLGDGRGAALEDPALVGVALVGGLAVVERQRLGDDQRAIEPFAGVQVGCAVGVECGAEPRAELLGGEGARRG